MRTPEQLVDMWRAVGKFFATSTDEQNRRAGELLVWMANELDAALRAHRPSPAAETLTAFSPAVEIPVSDESDQAKAPPYEGVSPRSVA